MPHPTMLNTFQDAATQAAILVSQDKREDAARALLEGGGAQLMRSIRHHSYHNARDEDAEEIMMDTLFAFITKPLPPECNAAAWLFAICHNKIKDWARHHQADKRGGQINADVALDDDELGNLLDTTLGHTELPGWVRTRIQTAAATMQQERPDRAMVMLMVAEGWSAEEIAIYFGADPYRTITDQQLAAARDRVYRAKKEAQEFFLHCKE